MNSSPVDVETLAARVEKLEAANRRWKSSSVIALLFVISMLLLSTRHAERVRAAAKPDRVEPDVLPRPHCRSPGFRSQGRRRPRLCAVKHCSEPDRHGSERPVCARLRHVRDTRSGIAPVLRRKGESGLERSEQAAVHDGKIGPRAPSFPVNTQTECAARQWWETHRSFCRRGAWGMFSGCLRLSGVIPARLRNEPPGLCASSRVPVAGSSGARCEARRSSS